LSRQSFGRTPNETKPMMQPDTPLTVPPGGGKATDVIGNAITIKIHGRDTGGAFALIQSVDKPNEGPPPHVHHREDETFYVLAGEYEFGCGGEHIRAKEGTTIFAPRDVPHHYKCVSQMPGRLLVVISPAGFERFFEEVNGLADVERVMAIGKKYGLEFLPPPGA
jgi:quercetin dioxygenase-like cupin family protein